MPVLPPVTCRNKGFFKALLGAQWDEVWAIRSAADDLKRFAPNAFVETVDVLELRAFTSFTDIRGNSKDEVATKFTLSRETASRINWTVVEARNFGRLLVGQFDGVYIHPALQKAWREYQAGQ
jgi:hypothetical protein